LLEFRAGRPRQSRAIRPVARRQESAGDRSASSGPFAGPRPSVIGLVQGGPPVRGAVPVGPDRMTCSRSWPERLKEHWWQQAHAAERLGYRARFRRGTTSGLTHHRSLAAAYAPPGPGAAGAVVVCSWRSGVIRRGRSGAHIGRDTASVIKRFVPCRDPNPSRPDDTVRVRPYPGRARPTFVREEAAQTDSSAERPRVRRSPQPYADLQVTSNLHRSDRRQPSMNGLVRPRRGHRAWPFTDRQHVAGVSARSRATRSGDSACSGK